MVCLPKKDQDFQLSWVVWGVGLAYRCGTQLLSGCVLVLECRRFLRLTLSLLSSFASKPTPCLQNVDCTMLWGPVFIDPVN